MQAPVPTVPGRLRLRFSQLKQQTEQLARMAAALRAIGGVIVVETSPLTGGLLIHYDAQAGKTTVFWDEVEAVLLAHQILLDPRPLDRQQGGAAHSVHVPQGDKPTGRAGSGGAERLAGKFVDGIASALVEKLIARSAFALVAVLL